jgi:hypothetical protein
MNRGQKLDHQESRRPETMPQADAQRRELLADIHELIARLRQAVHRYEELPYSGSVDSQAAWSWIQVTLQDLDATVFALAESSRHDERPVAGGTVPEETTGESSGHNR